MTKLRGYIPTMFMAATLMFGATAANAGIIITNRTESVSTTSDNPCEQESTLTKIAGSVATFLKTGIIITNRDARAACGIIITN